jgi:hypothetical protein
MGVNDIRKLWRNVNFKGLTPNSRLLYLYITTNPDVNSVGVSILEPITLSGVLGVDINEVRTSTMELSKEGFIKCDKVEGKLYFTALDYPLKNPRTQNAVYTREQELKVLPKKVLDRLKARGVTLNPTVKTFEVPTPEEINEFAQVCGYEVDANVVIDYYTNMAEQFNQKGYWVDSRGKKVLNWKAKLKRVWFKEDRKLQACINAPKGYEYFSVDIDGKRFYPDGWADGKPYSKNFLVKKALMNKFKNN